MKRTELVIMEVMLALFVFGIDKEGEVMIKGKNISKNFASRKIFWLLVIAVILLLVEIQLRNERMHLQLLYHNIFRFVLPSYHIDEYDREPYRWA